MTAQILSLLNEREVPLTQLSRELHISETEVVELLNHMDGVCIRNGMVYVAKESPFAWIYTSLLIGVVVYGVIRYIQFYGL